MLVDVRVEVVVVVGIAVTLIKYDTTAVKQVRVGSVTVTLSGTSCPASGRAATVVQR